MAHRIKPHLAAFIAPEHVDTANGGTPQQPKLGSDIDLVDAKRANGPDLAPREKEVLIAWLLTDNKDAVASDLHIAPATVRTHLQRVRAKYAAAGRPASTKAALVARAIQDGLINLDDL